MIRLTTNDNGADVLPRGRGGKGEGEEGDEMGE